MCEAAGLRKGGLEGLKSLRFWPQIARKFAIRSMTRRWSIFSIWRSTGVLL